jgi:hypothetical protein
VHLSTLEQGREKVCASSRDSKIGANECRSKN